jgi:hypothetical protein
MLAVVVVEAAAIALLALLVAGLLRSHGDILRALHELGASLDPDDHARSGVRPAAGPVPVPLRSGGLAPPSGTAVAHDVVGTRLDGSAVAVGVGGTAHDTVLAFLSTGCSTCEPFWSAFRAGVSLPGDARLVVVVQSEESESRLRELAGDAVDVVLSSAAWDAYGVPGSPHFVHVDGPAAQVVGEGTASTWPQVADLLGQAAADRAVSGRRTDRDDTDRDDTDRDNATRVDAELLAAGIGAGHPSLYAPPDDDGRHGR